MGGKTGIMVCGHGSRDTDAVREFEALARGVQDRLPEAEVEYGFLEFARPVIGDGLDALLRRGVTDILAVPGMLFAAGHVKNDIPSVLNDYQRRHGHVQIRCGRDLAIDLRLLRAATERIEAALAAAPGEVPPDETLLMVVGRGTSDPDANGNVAKVMRLLWEGLGLGWGETCYSGVTFPLVAPALEHAAKLGYRRIVVFPYFLFTGVLVRRIYDHTDAVAARHAGIQFVKAGYLNDHPLVIETVIDRIEEIADGANLMNCQMCKYRAQLVGFENEVGLAQQGHHHHVEGIGTGGDVQSPGHDGNGEGGNGGAPHGHRPPYPHADHPLGPLSMKRGPGSG